MFTFIAALQLLVPFCIVQAADPILIAHRGLLRHAPENTLPAFASCLELGMGFELDIRTTKDGKLVVLHDATLARTTDGPDRPLTEFTRDELRKFDAGSWFDPRFTGMRVPSLEETFGLIRERKRGATLIALNIKGINEDGERELVRLLAEFELFEESFAFDQSDECSRRLKALDPRIRIGRNVRRGELDSRLAEGTTDVYLLGFVPDETEVALLRKHGKTILFNYAGAGEHRRNEKNWLRVREAGLDGMLTDYPLECAKLWQRDRASTSPVMLAGNWVPEDPHQIDYAKLPCVPAEHAIISDVREHAGTRVHQHAYLAHHDDRFWAMWSDGPGGPRAGVTPEQHRNVVPAHDMPGTRNSFATSKDGLHWSKPADLTGPPRKKGFGWIARGLWKRDGELLALASHFDAPGYEGLGLSLEAFRWNGMKWVAHGTVLDDSMNNFPPKRLPSGEWMMTRRDHQRQVSVMIGGTKAFNDWRINPLAAYDGNGRPEEPYWYLLPDGKTIAGLIRDNGRSKFLLRTFSRDNGETWSEMHRTNFPDATSKFFVLRTSRGYYVMVSNSNPRKRDPLTLAISEDGLVFTKLFWLIGGRHVDYPHIIEQDGHLLIAFSGAKQTMEVMKVSLDELERLEMPASVESDKPLPPIQPIRKTKPATVFQPPGMWIWDNWFVHDGDQWHAFYLQVPKAVGPDRRWKNNDFYKHVGHAVSRDLFHWEDQGSALCALSGIWNDRHIATGSIIRHEDQWWKFFTGRGNEGDGVGLALSDDLTTWKTEPEPLIHLIDTFATESEVSYEAEWQGESVRWIAPPPTRGNAR